jgi:membrane protease YdiL (CAAX protease family)
MEPAPDAAPSRATPVPPPPADRRTLVEEVLVVVWLTFLSRVAGAILSLLEAPIAGVVVAAADQSSAFARQLLGFAVGVAPVFLVLHLVRRSGEGVAAIGLRKDRRSADAARGAALFALVGLAGIGVYLAAVELGVNRCVVPVPPLGHWWTIPALVLNAVEAALVEEVIVLGYLITRLQQLSWSPAAAIGASALLRGSYHLYQGWGGFAGNVAMGLVFGALFLRWGRRTWPFVVAHALLDIAAGVGFIFFRDSLPCF